MPPRRNVENQDAPENDVPTSAELARAVTQLAQLTQALGDRMLQDPPVNGNRNGGDMAKGGGSNQQGFEEDFLGCTYSFQVSGFYSPCLPFIFRYIVLLGG
nr:putative mediator of RNA polymerase II transcription subunit 24 [Ipomoea batatas]